MPHQKVRFQDVENVNVNRQELIKALRWLHRLLSILLLLTQTNKYTYIKARMPLNHRVVKALLFGDTISKLEQTSKQYVTKIVNEYDQEIPQSQTADNPVAPIHVWYLC